MKVTSDWKIAVMDFIRREALPVDKYGHQPRLATLAESLADCPELSRRCDPDVLFAAAWMHDLGVFTDHRPTDPMQLAAWDHVPYTVARSRELLSAWGFPAEKLELVAETIRTHEARYEPTIPESIVLRDADILEQLGVIGLLRAFVKVGRDTRYARFSDVVPVVEKARQTLPGQLRLARSRALAAGRIEVMCKFLGELEREAAGNLH
uniref:HD superfamily hydrolase n=1 Tax=mine drainage metagenome TaxID=410659 RepID=E6QJQ2_9ZZZZ